MGVHEFILGRELPCNVLELLGIRPLPLPGATHDELIEQVDAGRKYPDVLYRLGISHLGRQELGLARLRLQEAVSQKPAYLAARLALAGTLDLLAQHDLACDQLDAALLLIEEQHLDSTSAPRRAGPHVHSPSRYSVLCAAGFSLERLGTPGAAVFRYEQALESEPHDLFAHYRLAAIHLAHNNLEEAVVHHRAILEQEPQEAAVRTNLAHLLQLLGKHREAVWEYEKALCLAPDTWDLELELADQFERMGDHDQAIRRLRDLVARNTHFPDLHLRLANLYSARGDDREAVDEYAAALDVHPDYVECRIALARHELKMGRAHEALKHFQRALVLNEQNVEACAGLAVALHRLGKTQQAGELLSSASQISTNSEALVAQMGTLELQAEAADAADEPFNPEEFSSANVNRESQRRWIECQLKRYQQILNQHPTWTDVHMRHGMLLKLVGRTEDAARAFETAVSVNPDYGEAWAQLGLLRHERGDVNGAIEALEQAVRIKPEHAALHYRLGLIYCDQLAFDMALERMQQAVALNHQNPDFQRHLWLALQSLQLTGRANTTPPARAQTAAPYTEAA